MLSEKSRTMMIVEGTLRSRCEMQDVPARARNTRNRARNRNPRTTPTRFSPAPGTRRYVQAAVPSKRRATTTSAGHPRPGSDHGQRGSVVSGELSNVGCMDRPSSALGRAAHSRDPAVGGQQSRPDEHSDDDAENAGRISGQQPARQHAGHRAEKAAEDRPVSWRET